MPKVFTNAVLPASDLNSFMLQPGTSGTGTRVVSGKTAYTLVGGAINALSISYGFTFSAAPVVTGTVQSGSNVDIVLTWAGAPSTTGASARLCEKDGGASSQSGFVHWVAIGPP